MQQLTGAGCWDASQGATPAGTKLARPHERLTCASRYANGESGPRGATRARPRSAHPARRPAHPACPACRRPDIRAMHAVCSSEHMRVPGTCRGGGTPYPRSARTPLRFVVRLAQPHAAPAHPSATQQAPAAHCTPAAIAEKRFACPASRMRRRLSARPCGPRKIDGAVDLVARPPARAPGAHCCTSITAGMSKRASWSACRAARSGSAQRISRANGGSRTASRRPHPRRPRRCVGLAAGAADFPYGPVCGSRVRKREKWYKVYTSRVPSLLFTP